ncbi:MAG TPA: hypothetical protein VEY12_00855 [Thermoplasmata archaeon]|nr:hypothetical protein [Thermoplasmata archaeon]
MAVEVQGPGLVCASCGRGQLHGKKRTVESDLADAMIAAFEMLKPLNRW